jgi:hypothetical protein
VQTFSNVKTIPKPQEVVSVEWGGKELLDLIGETIFSEEEERLLAHANLYLLDADTSTAHNVHRSTVWKAMDKFTRR